MIDLEGPHPAPPSHAGGWLVTLVDLVSLLLSFFLIVYAGSAVPTFAWRETSHALRQAFGGSADAPHATLLANADDTAHAAADITTDHLAAVLARVLASDPQIACDETMPMALRRRCNVVVDALNERLVIALPHERVFYPHSGQLREETAAMLAALVPHLNRLDRPLAIAVEADDATRPFAFLRGRAVRTALRERGAGAVVPLFVIASREHQAWRQEQPCAAAASLGGSGSIVVCLTANAP